MRRRHPGDEQPCLDVAVLGHDFTLIDSAESKKNYAFKMSHPNKATLHFATNSRQAVGKWIEMLALAATGQNILAPYPPYFKPAVAKARSRESLASSEVREIFSLVGILSSSPIYSGIIVSQAHFIAAKRAKQQFIFLTAKISIRLTAPVCN